MCRSYHHHQNQASFLLLMEKKGQSKARKEAKSHQSRDIDLEAIILNHKRLWRAVKFLSLPSTPNKTNMMRKIKRVWRSKMIKRMRLQPLKIINRRKEEMLQTIARLKKRRKSLQRTRRNRILKRMDHSQQLMKRTKIQRNSRKLPRRLKQRRKKKRRK